MRNLEFFFFWYPWVGSRIYFKVIIYRDFLLVSFYCCFIDYVSCDPFRLGFKCFEMYRN